MMLGQYCGPALAGIKPANMICIKKNKLPLFKSLLQDYNTNMNRHDIYFSIINETEKSYLLLVYRKAKLAAYLSSPEVSEHLTEVGYANTEDIDNCIECLCSRFQATYGLPDEIGLFLGYPMEDVIGFKENKGKNCLMSKYWKVYSNVQEAEKLFSRYDKCKSALCKRLSDGISIMDMFAKSVA